MAAPKSPLSETVEFGRTLRLWDYDSAGYQIGYIDEDGCCWESCRERDLAITEGRFRDAVIQDGSGLKLPNALEIAKRECRDPDNIEDAAKAAESLMGNKPWDIGQDLIARLLGEGWRSNHQSARWGRRV